MGSKLKGAALVAAVFALIGFTSAGATAMTRAAATGGADLSLSITGPAAPVFENNPAAFTYTYSVTNNGPDGATGVVVTIPQSMGALSVWTATPSCPLGGGGTVQIVRNCTLGAIASGATASVTVTLTTSSAGAQTLTGSVAGTSSDPNPANDSASYAISVTPPSLDLGISVSGPTQLTVGQRVRYTLNLTNTVNKKIPGIVLTGQFPANLTPAFIGFAQNINCNNVGAVLACSSIWNWGSCFYPGPSGAGSFTCKLESPGAFTNIELLVDGIANAAGPATTSFQIANPNVTDTNSSNDAASITTTVQPRHDVDLEVTQSAPAQARVGDRFVVAATVTNHGPDQANGITLKSDWGPHESLYTIGGACHNGSGTVASITCQMDPLAAGASAIVTYTLNATSEGTATTQLTVATADVEANPSDNTVTSSTDVIAAVPAIACPANVSVPTDPGAATAAGVALGAPTASGGIAPLTVAGSRSDGAALTAPFPARSTTVTWTVTDAAAGTATCNQTVTVNDTEKPTLTGITLIPAANENGWNNSTPVQVRAGATDNVGVTQVKVGSASTPGPGPIGGFVNGIGITTVPISARDAAGNTEQTSVTVKVDISSPSVNCSLPSGWQKGNVDVQCTASDALSGIDGPTSFTLSTNVAEGVETTSAATGSRQVCDLAGNCVTAGPYGGIKVDRKGPSATCDPAPAGWHKDDVTVSCTAGDSGAGLAAADATFTLGTSVAVGEETSHASTGIHRVCDAVGNCSDAGPLTDIAVDRMAPTADCAGADGAWHGSDVTIACTAADGGSGVAGASTFSLTTSVADGTENPDAQTDSHQVCDTVGNCATVGPIIGNHVDRKAPLVSCDSADGMWHAANVDVACRATDGGSGLIPADQSFVLTTSVADGAESAAAPTGSRPVCDAVHNCTTAGPVGGNKVDRFGPTVKISPASGAALTRGSATTVTYSCADSGSGIATCSGSQASGTALDTSTVGTRTVTVDATDAVGNVTHATATYTVTANATDRLAALLTAVTGVGPGQSLANKVKQIQASVAANDKARACGLLDDFISEVKAQKGKQLTSAVADSLIAQANEIGAMLGC